MSHNYFAKPAALALLFSFVISTAALADEAPDEDAIDEIVVVADFRGRDASEAPPSISVLDRAMIEERAVQHFEELVFAVPNMNWSGDGHRARYFQIRGVGELEQYEGAPNPSVGFLIDDIDFSGIGTVATLFDIEQVDVLRGPQGSRYGANALAGLVYMQSTDPDDERRGRVQLGTGSDGSMSGGIAFGGPLGEGMPRYRIAAHHHASDGFRNNAYLGRDDTNRRRETMLRAKLDWEPAPDWYVRFTAMHSDIDNGYDAFAIDNSLTVLSDKPGKDAQQSSGAALRAEWGGSDRVTVTSITTAAYSDIDFSFDADWGNPEAWAPFTYDFITDSDRRRRTVSQEIRLASAPGGRLFADTTDWLAGVYVLQLDDVLTTLNRGEYVDPFFAFESTLDDRFSSDFEALSAAVFAQFDIDVGDSGLLTIGLRGERRTTRFSDSAGLELDPAESMLGGDLRYRHDVNDRTSAFIGLSRGYKAGGFNLGAVPDGRREFRQEALWNLEAGLRTSWLDGALVASGTLFHSRRRDQQVRTSFQLVPNDPASFVFFTDNAASGRTLGLEAELRFAPGDTWEWYASLGLLQAEFDDFVTPQVDLSGREQAHAPGYTAALGGIWRHPDGWFARVDVSARDEFYFDVSHDQQSDAIELANVRAGYEGERWSAEFWARNVFDERYAVRGFFFGNEPPDFPNELYIRQGDPRQVGITIERRF